MMMRKSYDPLAPLAPSADMFFCLVCGGCVLESSPVCMPVFLSSLHLSMLPLQLEAQELLAGFSTLHPMTLSSEVCV